MIAWQAGNDGPVGQSDRRPCSVAIDLAGKKERSIVLDRRQLLVLYCQTEIVGRPPSAQRISVACQILLLRPDEFRSY